MAAVGVPTMTPRPWASAASMARSTWVKSKTPGAGFQVPQVNSAMRMVVKPASTIISMSRVRRSGPAEAGVYSS